MSNEKQKSKLLTECSVADIQFAIVCHEGLERVAIPNVSFGFFTGMECDLIMESSSGLLHEYEIKRSKEDFLADFKKRHFHDDLRIAYLTFVLPVAMAGDWLKKFCEDNYKTFRRRFDFMFYADDICCGKRCASITTISSRDFITDAMLTEIDANDKERCYRRKPFLEERCQLYRLGCIRMWHHAHFRGC